MTKHLRTLNIERYRYIKIIWVIIALLVGLDATLLLAAQQIDPNSSQQWQQIQQLQQLAQAEAAPAPASAAPEEMAQNMSSQNMPPPQAMSPHDMSQSAPVSGNMPQQMTNRSASNNENMPPKSVPTTGANGLPQPDTMQQPAQQQMVGAVDPEAAAKEGVFNAMTQNFMPLSTDQIKRLHEQFNANQFASQVEGTKPPRPVASSRMVSLAPGSTPPVVRLAQGFVSSLVFVDSTGAPWPIKYYDLGNPNAFNIQWDKQSNMLLIQAMQLYTYGNLAVQLQGLPTPVMITLIPGQKAIDYRVDLRIQGVGPNAKALPMGGGLPGVPNPVLLGVLDGVPPPGSRSYEVLGGPAQVWLRGDKLYLRTHMTLLSPGWIATMASADGMKAYELPQASMLLVSDNGKVTQLKIEGL